MSRPARPLAERFATKVSTTPTETGCLLWLGFKDKIGRGFIKGVGRAPMLASRAAWSIAHGEISPGQCVCHRCDNPTCVNVEHLFLGTQTENVADMMAKKRSSKGKSARGRRGERHGCAVLTWQQVDEIRARYAAGGVMQRELAAEFGVARQAIGYVIRGKLWRHPEDKIDNTPQLQASSQSTAP